MNVAGGRDRCSACLSSRRGEIDAALVAGVSIREVAKRFELSASAVHRHRAHISIAIVRIEGPQSVEASTNGSAVNSSDDVAAEARRLYVRCRDLLDEAIASGNPLQIALAGREARAALELLGKQIDRLEHRRVIGVVDVQRSEEWTAIRRIVVELVPVELRPTLAARLMALDQDPRRGTSPDLNPN